MSSPSSPRVSLSSLSSLISPVLVVEFLHMATTYLEKIFQIIGRAGKAMAVKKKLNKNKA